MVIFNKLDNIYIPEKTAIAIGFFDGMHIGHQKVVNTALSYQKSGYKTCVFSFTVGNTSYSKERTSLKILSIKDKTAYLESIGVDYFINPDFSEFKHLNPYEFVETILYGSLNAKIVCCGFDFRYGTLASGNTSTLINDCDSLGIKTEIVESVNIDGYVASSTVIRQAILAGDMELAATILGRPYYYSLPVVEGKKLGRTLGFPTINQRFPDDQVKPVDGVYASTSTINGVLYYSVTSIGKNPTVGGESTVSETHIMEIDKNLYGKDVTISLHSKLRPQYKFANIDELTNQIRQDIISTKSIFHIK